MPQRMRFVLLAAAVLLLIPRGADACTCRGPVPACEAVWQADAVFIGFVRAVEPMQPPRLDDPAAPLPPDAQDQRRVRMAVSEVFRGTLPAEAVVHTGAGGGDCGYEFLTDRPYLVYARRGDDGVLRTSLCSNTRPIEDATADLAYVRTLNQLVSSRGTIQGTARLIGDDPMARQHSPFAGARVIAVSESFRFETFTGADGSYELRVPAGAYDLQAEVPEGLLASVMRTVEVRDPRGCAQADVGIRPNGRLAGRLLTARGEPMAQTSVMLYQFQASPQLPGRPPREPILTARNYAMTDAAGAFEFTGMAAGSYFVGVPGLGERTPANTRGPILYPGAIDPAAATAVTIPPRAPTVMDDYVLPASIVLVRGVVRAADGRPLPEIPVLLLTLSDSGLWTSESWLRSQGDGTFQFTTHAGLPYRIIAGTDIGRYEDVRLPPDPARRPRAETPVFEANADLWAIELLLQE